MKIEHTTYDRARSTSATGNDLVAKKIEKWRGGQAAEGERPVTMWPQANTGQHGAPPVPEKDTRRQNSHMKTYDKISRPPRLSTSRQENKREESTRRDGRAPTPSNDRGRSIRREKDLPAPPDERKEKGAQRDVERLENNRRREERPSSPSLIHHGTNTKTYDSVPEEFRERRGRRDELAALRDRQRKRSGRRDTGQPQAPTFGGKIYHMHTDTSPSKPPDVRQMMSAAKSSSSAQAQRDKRKDSEPASEFFSKVGDIAPQLRRKHGFVNLIREKFLPKEEVKERTSEERKQRRQVNMEKIHAARNAMRKGQIEQVVPPSSSRGSSRDRFPPRNIIRDARPVLAPEGQQSSESGGTMVDSLGESANMTNAIRQNMVGNFNEPFEYLSYELKERRRSSVSDESFFYEGDEGIETERLIALKMRQRRNDTVMGAQEVEDESRSSGEGRSLWDARPVVDCRLCKTKGKGISTRGLCCECETDFMRPSLHVNASSSWASQIEEEEEETRPTPPPKDKSTLDNYYETEAKDQPYEYPRYGRESDSNLQDGYNEERFRSWQTPQMRAEFDSSRDQIEEWSNAYDLIMNEVEHAEVEKEVRGPTGKPIEIHREPGFYDFYDGLLDEDTDNYTARRNRA